MKKLLILIATLLLTACNRGSKVENFQSSDIQKYFEEYNVEGTFVLKEAGTGKIFIYNKERAETGYLPASTFKIFNSLVSLDLGVIGIDDVVKWDGVEREYAVWNQDQRMREAFQRSTVWFYQVLARKVGDDRMQAAISREKYGNKNISGGIDQFWLNGGLRISATQQIDFLQRLHKRKLSFSPDTIQKVENLLLLEQCPAYTLRGKSGWTQQDGKQLGWLVGWVEKENNVYYYAMNLESADSGFPMIEARKTIVYNILRLSKVIPKTCTK